jgi:hypothetical protein
VEEEVGVNGTNSCIKIREQRESLVIFKSSTFLRIFLRIANPAASSQIGETWLSGAGSVNSHLEPHFTVHPSTRQCPSSWLLSSLKQE